MAFFKNWGRKDLGEEDKFVAQPSSNLSGKGEFS
jgi:hypothetical protein